MTPLALRLSTLSAATQIIREVLLFEKISVITATLLSTAAAWIVPFVKIYTKGVAEANYAASVFLGVLILASFVICLKRRIMR